MRHTIEDLSFGRGIAICACDDTITGATPEALRLAYNAHRLADGQVAKGGIKAGANRLTSSVWTRQTICGHGHRQTRENVYLMDTGRRLCRLCRRAAQKRYDSRVRAERVVA